MPVLQNVWAKTDSHRVFNSLNADNVDIHAPWVSLSSLWYIYCDFNVLITLLATNSGETYWLPLSMNVPFLLIGCSFLALLYLQIILT